VEVEMIVRKLAWCLLLCAACASEKRQTDVASSAPAPRCPPDSSVAFHPTRCVSDEDLASLPSSPSAKDVEAKLGPGAPAEPSAWVYTHATSGDALYFLFLASTPGDFSDDSMRLALVVRGGSALKDSVAVWPKALAGKSFDDAMAALIAERR
jgi:hypothetical protein